MAALPKEIILENDIVRLEPLRMAHKDGMRSAAADGELWNNVFTVIPSHGNEDAYIQKAMDLNLSIPFAVINKKTGAFAGCSRLYNYDEENLHIMLGYTWYAASAQGTPVNPASKLLLLSYAFETLGCGAVELQVDNLNTHSLAAVKKLGAKIDGMLRNHKKRKDGSYRTTVSHSITADEWPSIKSQLQKRITK